MSAQLAAFAEDKKQYQEQLDLVLISLKDDPENAELLGLQAELADAIKLIDETIADLQPKRPAGPPPPAAAAAAQPSPSPAAPEKWSRENHPAFRKAGAARPEDKEPPQEPSAAPASYQVNDTVLAKWVSGDKGFYPARITSVTGSSTDPIYTVKFKSYDTVETLRARDVRPVAGAGAAQKRKADSLAAGPGGATTTASPGPSTASPAPGAAPAGSGAASGGSGIVMTAAASVYPRPPEADDKADGAPRKPKKIKATKELEAGKSKWQEFNQKSKFAKGHKKDSMFRTPEGVHGRVGFTGSGHPMRKDPTRSRHIYQPNEELD